MPEPDPAKRFLLRRRIILGAIVFVVVPVVSVFVFGALKREPAIKISATFLRFQMSAGGTSTVALVVLTNLSRDIYYRSLLDSSGLMPNWLPHGSQFESDSPNDLRPWDPHRSTTGLSAKCWPAPLAVTNEFELPADGRRGRIFVQYLEPSAPGWLRAMGRAFGVRPGDTYIVRWVECDEVIQCPLVRSNGTVEPARVVSKGNEKGQ